ncbi:MAG: hypothetical protein ACLTR6_16415 [Clostridium fessum]
MTTSKTVTAMQNSDLTWKAGGKHCGRERLLRTCGEADTALARILNQNAETISIAYRVTDETNADRTNPTAQTYPRRREAIFRLACRIHWTIREIHTGLMVCR